MSTAYVFPGQGAQYPGMGKDLYENHATAKALFDKADEVLGFSLSKIMFEGTAEELKETKVTQPAIFTMSVIMAKLLGDDFKPDMVAGHSLGEFSALTAAGALRLKTLYCSLVNVLLPCKQHVRQRPQPWLQYLA